MIPCMIQHIAACEGHLGLVQLLVDNKADVVCRYKLFIHDFRSSSEVYLCVEMNLAGHHLMTQLDLGIHKFRFKLKIG